MGVLVRLIRRLNDAAHLSSIIVSHDVQETAEIADMIHVISNGQVVGSGTPNELTASKSDWVRQFIHGEADGPVPFHFPSADDLKADLIAGGRS